jgi:phosphoglycolate phosphatase
MGGGAQDWPRAVVFDLDGTLIDSAPDIAYALNRALERRDLAPFSADEVKSMIGGGVPKLVERAILARGIAIDEGSPLAADFIEYYRENLTTLTTLYEGARGLPHRLQEKGLRLGLCTNKQQALTLEILGRLELTHYFLAVAGELDGYPRKPDPAPLLGVLGELGVLPRDSLMVGDSAADIEYARAAGVSAVAVSFGYSRIAPAALGADAVIASLGELPCCLSNLKLRKKAN